MTCIYDDFNRVVADDWGFNNVPAGYTGTTQTGFASGSKFLVDGSRGYMALPAYTPPFTFQYTVYQSGRNLYDYPLDVAVTLDFTDLLQTNFHMDFGEDGLPVEYTFVPSAGTVYLDSWLNFGPTVSGLDWTSPYRVRFYVDGATLKFKFWRPGEAEPAAWAAEFTDSAMVGSAAPHSRVLQCNLVQVRVANTFYPETGVYFDDCEVISNGVTIVSTCPCEGCAQDTLTRTVASPNWGGNWTTGGSSAPQDGITPGVANIVNAGSLAVDPSVFGSSAGEFSEHRLSLTGACTTAPFEYLVGWKATAPFPSYEAYNTVGSPPPGDYNFPGTPAMYGGYGQGVPFQVLDFRFDSNLTPGLSTNTTHVRVAMDASSGYWSLHAPGAGVAFQLPVPFTFIAGHTYKIRMHETLTTVQAKMWDAAGAEPDAWAFTTLATRTEDQIRPLELSVVFQRGIGISNYPPFTFDPIRIDLVFVGCEPSTTGGGTGGTTTTTTTTAAHEFYGGILTGYARLV